MAKPIFSIAAKGENGLPTADGLIELFKALSGRTLSAQEIADFRRYYAARLGDASNGGDSSERRQPDATGAVATDRSAAPPPPTSRRRR